MFWIIVIVVIAAFVLYKRAKSDDGFKKSSNDIQKYSSSVSQPNSNYFEALEKNEEKAAQQVVKNQEISDTSAQCNQIEDCADSVDVTENIAEQVEGWKKDAENDDANAMMLLGQHYQSLDTFEGMQEAAKWYDRAADAGKFTGMYYSMLIHPVLAIIDQNPNVGGWRDALETWKKVDQYASTIIRYFQDGTFTMDMNGGQEILDNAYKCKSDALYGMCVSYYQMDDRKTVISLLQNKTSTRECILCGLCMVRHIKSERDISSSFSQAYEKLALVDTDATYRLEEKSEIEQYIYAGAALYLAVAYREGISVAKNCNKSYEVLNSAYNAVSSRNAKNLIDKELNRYEKKAFGDYTYN